MSSDFYFFDQYSRASHIGGVHRTKREMKDFNQALYHVKINLPIENENLNNKIKIDSFKPIKNQIEEPKLLPDILTKELDSFLQIYDDRSKINSELSTNEDNQHSISIIPKISLPASLIIQLHSTWTNLIQNANYKYKIWQTKSGEESWKQYIQQKRLQQLNSQKSEENSENKSLIRRRTSSRISISSISNISPRQSFSINNKIRLSQSFSRSSFLSTNQDLRLFKSLNQNINDNSNETIKNGIHVEFKLSTPDKKSKQKIVLFDIPKPDIYLDEDILTFTQNKCKNLLNETKQKIFQTTFNQKLPKISFYEDNQFIKNKNNILITNHRPKSKFVLSILRNEIPDKYQIDLNFPSTKHKFCIELSDGSIQIYYPSGRLAVLHLSCSCSTTLFFDDIDLSTKQFLGLVTSTGNIILMNPSYYTHFITNHQTDHVYLCNGKTGFIQKQFQFNSKINNNQDKIQIQLNSYMKIEYENNSNILFSYSCQNQLIKFQLSKKSTLFKSITTKILATQRMSLSTKTTNSNLSNLSEKQSFFNKKNSNDKNLSRQSSIINDFNLLKNRIQNICSNWLKECRTILGILNINDYHLPDFPSESIVNKSTEQIRCQSEKQISLKNFESNVIANVIEQFVPKSASGQAIKQRIYTKKILPI